MKILFACSPPRFYYLHKYANAISDLGHKSKLVKDLDIFTGFPDSRISEWFCSKNKFNDLISSFKPDLIFVERGSNFAKLALKTGIPVLFHLRGDYWSEIKWARDTLYKGPVRRFALWCRDMTTKKCFDESKAILPICNYLKTVVDQRYPNKSFVMYQGIDPEDWKSQDGMSLKHPCVGMLQSASIWGKTSEMLILEPVIKSNPEITFYWAGGGPYLDKILSVLEKYQNFKWLGELEYPGKVREYLSEIDVYALVTGIDMSPLTLLEAQLMKKPVLATDVGGVSELMKNKVTGFLLKKGDSEDLSEKISLLLKDKQGSIRMGEAGRKFVEDNFNWGKIASEFIANLEKIGLLK